MTALELTALRSSLDASIASGVTSIQVAGRTISYRSMDEMLEARAFVTKQLADATGASSGATKRFVFSTHRGD
jgi:uncharacterized protein YunC (DUF1805 family)